MQIGELEPWLRSIAEQYQFLGVFFISFVGALSIFFPIPYQVVIVTLGSLGWNPLLLAIAGGLGSATGELSGYALGYYGARLMSEERRRKMEFFVKIFDKYGPVAIFIFALTPLPDDLLLIPLGILRYKFWKTFIPCVAGKFLICFILAYFGGLFRDLVILIFGEEGSWLGMAITMVALFIVLLVLLKVDWEQVFKKYVGKERLGIK